MFHEGDVQSGIALALRDSKRVVCFVRDDEEESKTWEHEYLADSEISELLDANSVTLRLTSGTREVGFLSSFCPINRVPTLVVIKDGVLQEYIVPGTSEEELKNRLKASLREDTSPEVSQQREQQQQQQHQEPLTAAPATPQPSIPPTSTPNHFDSTGRDAGPTEEDSAAERSRREEIRRGKRREAVDEEGEDQRSNRRTWKQQQRRREQQGKEERERVLARIRHDKEERKAKAEERKFLSGSTDDNAASVSADNRSDKPGSAQSSQFRLQVRVFDGSSIRSSFLPSQTIRGDVRPWIDAQRNDGDTPYTLKQILNPLPSRAISVAEEDQTLDELGLGPTANLVMVPVPTYTQAYPASSPWLPFRLLYAGYDLATSIGGTVIGALGTFLGYGQGQRPSGTAQEGHSAAESSPPASGTRRSDTPERGTAASNVRTLYSQRSEQRADQLYNGNQLNFEPRKDETKDD